MESNQKKYSPTKNIQVKNIFNGSVNKKVRILGSLISFKSPNGLIDDGTGLLTFMLNDKSDNFERDKDLLEEIMKSEVKTIRIVGFIYVDKKPILKVNYIQDQRDRNLDLHEKVLKIKEKYA